MRDPVIPYYTHLMTKIDADRPCPQHHQPRSQCRPSDRHVHTMRFRDDDWAAAEEAAWAAKSDVTTLTTLAMNVISDGYIRCYRCRDDAPPVTVVMGDLTGVTLREALLAAEKQVVSQHLTGHEPVFIGAGSAVAPVAAKAVRFVEPKQASRP